MKNSFVSFCLFTILLINCTTTGSTERTGNTENVNGEILGECYVESNAGFSMYIPKGWTLINTNQKYKLARGPVDNNYAPNIAFSDGPYIGPISDYIDVAFLFLSQMYTNPEIIQEGNITTNSGLQGEYITIQGRVNNLTIRQRMYVIPNNERTEIMTITGTTVIAHGNKYDSIFDECVKTFEWTK